MMKHFKYVLLLFVLFLVACKKDVDSSFPDLYGKTQQEMQTIFKEKGIIVTVNYEYRYSPTLEENTIYGASVKPKEIVEPGSVITVYINTKEFVLPNLTGLNKDEMTAKLLLLGLQADQFGFLPDINQHVKVGTFIQYRSGKMGDRIDPTTQRVSIFYDTRILLEDLSGQNKLQIDDYLREKTLNPQYVYEVDNNKEHDTFKGYEGYIAGDAIEPGKPLTIVLYSNDDVNISKDIKVSEQLMFSKYIDAKGNNKGIEIYNPTNDAINLADYYIAILPNGAYVAEVSIELTGSLASKETYVMMNTGASEALKLKADLLSNDLFFDGNDVIQLRKAVNHTYIDTLNDIGETSIFMNEEIFIRKSSITHGNRDYVFLDWEGYIPEFIEPIGTHPYDGFETPPFEYVDKIFPEYGMTKVTFSYLHDGDTAAFKSIDPRDTASYTGDNRVRYLLIDTPETEKPGVVGEPYAQVATEFNRSMLQGASELYIQADPGNVLRDTYGRALGFIWANMGTVEAPDWKLINYELAKAGLGEPAGAVKNVDSPIFGNRYLYQWVIHAAHYAQENKLGIYSGVYKP